MDARRFAALPQAERDKLLATAKRVDEIAEDQTANLPLALTMAGMSPDMVAIIMRTISQKALANSDGL